MNFFSFSEIRLMIAKSTTNNNINISYLKTNNFKQKYFSHRINLIKTLKTYVKKYCNNSDKYNVLYLSILYLDIILSKNKISLSHDKNLKYLCLCCFLISLKFIGNYNNSKKIITNFCKNYKEEYKIFEMQCLILLEYNLLYTTAYNYLNMILINESKKLLSLCYSLLYQICEDITYSYFSPFYISIAIFKLAKTCLKDNSHNHYDKYFHDERVKYLLKKFNYLINPPSLKSTLLTERNILSDNLNNTISNTNIITNNNIQNNIVIINKIQKKKNDNIFNNTSNSSFFPYRPSTPLKINIKGNIRRKKEFETLNNNIINFNNNNKGNIKDNDTKEYFNNYYKYHNKINSLSYSKNNNLFSKSHYSLCRIKNNNNKYNNHKTITIKQSNNKIGSFSNGSNSSNCLSYFNSLPKKKYEKNSFEIKKNLYKSKINKEESLSTDIQTPNQINYSNKINGNEKKKSVIFVNKSSLNFQLVSGISKEKLFKLSRNFSKKMLKSNEKSFKKGNNK